MRLQWDMHGFEPCTAGRQRYLLSCQWRGREGNSSGTMILSGIPQIQDSQELSAG